jgi:hypothetical protein
MIDLNGHFIATNAWTYSSNQEQCEDTKGQSESVNRKGTDNTRSKSPFQTKKKREKKRIIYLLMTDS